MRFQKTYAHSGQASEVVLNLWAYADNKDGYVMRLAGRAYVMEGSDDDKLTLLHQLARSDFLAAPWVKVPANFAINNPEGQAMKGVAHASLVSIESSHAHMFAPLIESLAKELPDQVREVNGEYVSFKAELPQDPLCVTTVIIEHDDGRLVPMVSKR